MDRQDAERLAAEIAGSPESFKERIAGAIRAEAPETDPTAIPQSGGPRRIRIWEPERIGGKPAFTRPPPNPLGDHFAARRTIPAEKPAGTRRVCLFGESTAAGYLYAPWLTPAGLLQAILDGAAGQGRFEVIDLARTNETLDGMATAMDESLQLFPDVFVIFAGNNWALLETPEISPHAGDVRARHALGGVLAEGGLFGAIERARRVRLERSGAFLEWAAALAGAHDIHVVVVVPEVNLADWADLGPVPWLPEDGNARWHTLLDRALFHINGGEWSEAFAAGEAMLTLDRGTCPTGFQILAWAVEGMGKTEKAARASRAAADALHYPLMCTLGTPRVTSMDQALLREGSRHHGFDLVDLPDLFAAWTGDPYPGRRMFLDYCHLTAEGMRVAAAGVAAQLVTGRTWQELAAAVPTPELTAEQDAAAKFGAALHNAHRLPGHPRRREILEHWIDAALDADPGVATRMFDLAEARVGGGRIELTKAHARNRDAAAPVLYAHGWEYPHLDAAVLEAVLAVLSRRGSPDARRIAALLAGAAPNAGDVLELTDPYHLAEPLDRPFYELSPDRLGDPGTILRSFRPEISFVFLSDGQRGCTLRVCARSRASAAETFAGIQLNGVELEPIALGGDWRAVERELPAAVLAPGINRLRLTWPLRAGAGGQGLRAAVDRLERGAEADLFPVFGELYSVLLKAT